MPHGWIILDKPHGLGSTQAVAAVKRVCRQAGLGKVKVGHGDGQAKIDQTGHAVAPDAAGNDAVEMRQVGFDIDRDAVKTDPAADLDADRGDLVLGDRAIGAGRQIGAPAHIGQGLFGAMGVGRGLHHRPAVTAGRFSRPTQLGRERDDEQRSQRCAHQGPPGRAAHPRLQPGQGE